MDAKTDEAIATQFDRADWLEPALADFRDSDLMVQMDGHHLSLALPKNPYI
jgi:hypothetical protein